MNFDLTELAATLAIGVFTIVGVRFVLLMFWEKNLSSVFEFVPNINQYAIAVIAAFCFVVGMIIEDVSNKFVDDDTWLNRRGVLASDDEIKAKVFFGENYRATIHESPLSFFASKYGLLREYGGAEGAALEDHILLLSNCTPVPTPTPAPTFTLTFMPTTTFTPNPAFAQHQPTQSINGQLNLTATSSSQHNNTQADKKPEFRRVELNEGITKSVAKQFYYNAKSLTYKDPSYYNELKRIQMRIDFSRSLVAVSLCLLILVTALTIVTLIAKRLLLDSRRVPETNQNHENATPFDRFIAFVQKLNVSVTRVVACGAILGLMFFVARFAYTSEEVEFNKRTYGYYISLKVNSDVRHSSPVCKEPTRSKLRS